MILTVEPHPIIMCIQAYKKVGHSRFCNATGIKQIPNDTMVNTLHNDIYVLRVCNAVS